MPYTCLEARWIIATIVEKHEADEKQQNEEKSLKQNTN